MVKKVEDYKEILDYISTNNGFPEPYMKKLKKLINKTKPKKVVVGSVGWKTKSNPEWVYNTTYSCPACKEYIDGEVINYSYCPYCGQAIDNSTVEYND